MPETKSCFERAKSCGAAKCTEDEYYEALGSLPPEAYFLNGFAMGEPYCGDTFYCFFNFGDAYWCVLTTILEAKEIHSITQAGVLISDTCVRN